MVTEKILSFPMVSVLKKFLEFCIKVPFYKRNISYINIAPGPIGTERLKDLVDNIADFESGLPMRRVGKVEEIGEFVKSIVEKEIKYLTGVTINFDGGHSNYVL